MIVWLKIRRVKEQWVIIRLKIPLPEPRDDGVKSAQPSSFRGLE